MASLQHLHGSKVALRNVKYDRCGYLDGRGGEPDALVTSDTNRPAVGDKFLNWTIESLGSGMVALKSVSSGRYFAVPIDFRQRLNAEGCVNHVFVTTKDSSSGGGGALVNFVFEPISSSSTYLIKSESGHYLSRHGGSNVILKPDFRPSPSSPSYDPRDFHWAIETATGSPLPGFPAIKTNVRAMLYGLKNKSSGYLDGRGSGNLEPFVANRPATGDIFLYWSLEPVDSNTFAIKSMSGGRYLDGQPRERGGGDICPSLTGRSEPESSTVYADSLQWIFEHLGSEVYALRCKTDHPQTRQPLYLSSKAGIPDAVLTSDLSSASAQWILETP